MGRHGWDMLVPAPDTGGGVLQGEFSRSLETPPTCTGTSRPEEGFLASAPPPIPAQAVSPSPCPSPQALPAPPGLCVLYLSPTP